MNKNEQTKKLTDKELEGVSGGVSAAYVPESLYDDPRVRATENLLAKMRDAGRRGLTFSYYLFGWSSNLLLVGIVIDFWRKV